MKITVPRPIRDQVTRPAVVRALRSLVKDLADAGSPELALWVTSDYLCPIRDGITIIGKESKSGAGVQTLRSLERQAILGSWERNGGQTSKVAKELGMSIRKVQYMLVRYREEGWR